MTIGDTEIPIALPTIAADGSVAMPAEAWDGVEALIGYLGALVGGFLSDAVNALGWTPEDSSPAASPEQARDCASPI